MYLYRQSSVTGRWEVGFYSPSKGWYLENDFETQSEAVARVAYLNGKHPLSDNVCPVCGVQLRVKAGAGRSGNVLRQMYWCRTPGCAKFNRRVMSKELYPSKKH